jgi:hypothetical protein
MGKTNSATDSDDEAGVNYGNSFAFSIIHVNIIHSYAATTNNFNPGQASIMSRTLVALRTRTTSTLFSFTKLATCSCATLVVITSNPPFSG